MAEAFELRHQTMIYNLVEKAKQFLETNVVKVKTVYASFMFGSIILVLVCDDNSCRMKYSFSEKVIGLHRIELTQYVSCLMIYMRKYWVQKKAMEILNARYQNFNRVPGIILSKRHMSRFSAYNTLPDGPMDSVPSFHSYFFPFLFLIFLHEIRVKLTFQSD